MCVSLLLRTVVWKKKWPKGASGWIFISGSRPSPLRYRPCANGQRTFRYWLTSLLRNQPGKWGKQFRGINPLVLDELVNYAWPGNIRELENVMEQAVILNDGQTPLELGRPLVSNLFMASRPTLPPENATRDSEQSTISPPKDLNDIKQIQLQTEREYILAVLKRTNGRIRGSNGAAEVLNLKPTTLEYRMDKLGIRKTVSIDPQSSLD